MAKSPSEMDNMLASFEAFQSGNIRIAKDKLEEIDLSSLIRPDFLGELTAKLRDSDLKKTDGKGDTALHLAVREDLVDLVKILVKLDASLCDRANKDGETPLKLAISLRLDEAVELLLTRTSNALHLIVELNQVELVEYLMDKNVRLSKFINQPYQLAENRATNPQHGQAVNHGHQHTKVKSPTNASGDRADKPLESAAENQNKPKEKNSTDSTDTDTQQNQPIVVMEDTASNGDAGGTSLQRNGDTTNKQQDQPIVVKGDTPLHIAARNKYEDMVNLLLKVDRLDKHALNSEDKTAFDIAREVTEYHESFRSIRRLRGSKRRPKRFMYCAPQVSHQKYKNAMSMLNRAYKERRNAELVVAALLAAMTCAALFTVPGGFNSESPVKEDHGSPLLISLVAFKLFISFDCIAFFLSLFVCIMWEMSTEFTTRNKMVFMSYSSFVICLSFGFSACGFMCAVYAMIARKVETFSWVVLGNLIVITLCGALEFIHQFVDFVVKRARFQRLCGDCCYLDNIVEKVWSEAERWCLLDLCNSCEDVLRDLITGQAKFNSYKDRGSSNNSHSPPSCSFNHV